MRAEIDARDVFDAQQRTVRIRADDNPAELFGIDQTSLSTNRVRHLRSRHRRIAADLAGRIDGILLIQSIRQICNREPQFRKDLGFDPNAHRVIGCSEEQHLARAGDAQELIVDVDVGVVGQKQRIVSTIRRIQCKRKKRQACGLADGRTEPGDIRRQIGRSLRQTVLDVDFVGIDVGVDVECDGQRHRIIVTVRRLHVEHVVDAIHLLFDRSGNGLFDGLSVGAGIRSGHDDLRRDNVRELRLGQPAHRHQAGKHGNDGDNDGDNRAPYEKLSHGLTLLCRSA